MAQDTNAAWTLDHVLNRIGATLNYPRFKDEATEQANKDLIDAFMKDLGKFFDDYLTQAQAIERNPGLSPVGVQEKLAPVQRQFDERLNSDMCKRIRTLQELHLKKVIQVFELPAEVVQGDPVILEMRSREIRDYCRSLDMPNRIKLLIGSGDPLLIHAFETCPPCINLVPVQILDMARLNRVKRKRAADLIPLQDEREALLRIVGVFENIPKAFGWLSIVPGFMPMGESVIPEPEEQDPVVGGGEDAELMRLAAEMVAEYAEAA